MTAGRTVHRGRATIVQPGRYNSHWLSCQSQPHIKAVHLRSRPSARCIASLRRTGSSCPVLHYATHPISLPALSSTNEGPVANQLSKQAHQNLAASLHRSTHDSSPKEELYHCCTTTKTFNKYHIYMLVL